MTTIDVIAHNAQAWDNHVKNASQWTVPVSHEEIEAARAGLFHLISFLHFHTVAIISPCPPAHNRAQPKKPRPLARPGKAGP